jgi:Holliday junction resolvase RusA-like endonuclease
MNAPFHIADELVINLPICPSTNNLFSSDGKRRFRSARYEAWLKHAGHVLNVQRPPLMAGRVSLLIEIKNPETARRQDCTNRIKAVEDLLVSHRIIQGDDQRYVRCVTVAWADVEGVRVTIRSAE